jgi:DNA polymerase elongation subunit (family B)
MSYETGLDYESFIASIMETVKRRDAGFRVLSLDLETKITDRKDFLTGERLLGIGMARRCGGEVESRVLRLKDDSDEAEIELLNGAAAFMGTVRPLVLLGYNISGYDYPLLNLKLKWYDEYHRDRGNARYPREYWSLKDALTRAYVLDIMHPLRFELARLEQSTPKYRSLSSVVSHPRFASLPLKRLKHLAEGSTTEEKGKRIYEMWRSNDPDFERYLEGDVHDTLLLAEELYGFRDLANR